MSRGEPETGENVCQRHPVEQAKRDDCTLETVHRLCCTVDLSGPQHRRESFLVGAGNALKKLDLLIVRVAGRTADCDTVVLLLKSP